MCGAINISPLCGATDSVEQLTDLDTRMMTRALELASCGIGQVSPGPLVGTVMVDSTGERSEEHTSELQSPYDLVCRLLLEKKKQEQKHYPRRVDVDTTDRQKTVRATGDGQPRGGRRMCERDRTHTQHQAKPAN